MRASPPFAITPEPGLDRRRTHLLIAVFYATAALLGGPRLERAASHLEYGHPLRPTALAAARPLAEVARAVGLDRPLAALEAWVDRIRSAGSGPAAPPSAPLAPPDPAP